MSEGLAGPVLEFRLTTWFRPTLAADIQAAVLADRDRHPDPVVRRKMNVLGAVHLGHSRLDAARLAHVGVATAKRYIIAYRDGGLDGLKRREIPRRPTSDLAAHVDRVAGRRHAAHPPVSRVQNRNRRGPSPSRCRILHFALFGR